MASGRPEENLIEVRDELARVGHSVHMLPSAPSAASTAASPAKSRLGAADSRITDSRLGVADSRLGVADSRLSDRTCFRQVLEGKGLNHLAADEKLRR